MTSPTLESDLEAFAHDLVVAVINLDLHSPYSAEVQTHLGSLLQHLRSIQKQGVETAQIEFGEDQIIAQSKPLLGASLQARRLLDLTREREIARLSFGPRVDTNELLRFLVLLTSDSEVDAFRSGSLDQALTTHGIQSIGVGLRGAANPGSTAASATESAPMGEDAQAIRGYQDLADCLQDNHVAAARGEILHLERAAGVVEQAVAELDREPSGLLSLAYYDDIDSFTVGHSVRVALLTIQVARAAGACEQTLMKAGTAGLLHDIGKSRIPQSVLFKQGPLDDEEWRLMGMHPRLGAEILIEQPDIDPSAIGAAFCHHMAPGARSYPTPALPFQPSGVSKLVRVCDVFEALTSVRPYKPAMSPVEAYVIMHRTPGDFDPAWLRFFVDAIGLYPVGTKLQFSTGEFGKVIGHGSRRDQPRVRVLEDADGNPLRDGVPDVVTIGDDVDGVCRQIAAVVPRRRLREEPQTDPNDPATNDLKKPCC